MGVRVRDIAAQVGVSATTVSLALNNKPGVGAETRERIIRVAKELGHIGPRGSAEKPLATESVRFLHIARHGHAVNRDHDVFIADYIEGLGQGARQLAFKLEIETFKSTPIDRIIEGARAADSAGFIVLGTELGEDDVAAFGGLSRPVVFIDTYLDFLPFDFVDMNNEDSVFSIVRHLAMKGHREIGMVKGSIETRNFKLREEGFVESLSRLGLKFDPSRMFSVDSTFHGAHEDMAAILARGGGLPGAIFCANDIIACGCMRAFRQAGLRIPEDISVVGFDDLPISAISDPPLTTMMVSKARIGQMAMQLLSARLRSEPDAPPAKVLIGGQLIERHSVLDLGSAPLLEPGSEEKGGIL